MLSIPQLTICRGRLSDASPLPYHGVRLAVSLKPRFVPLHRPSVAERTYRQEKPNGCLRVKARPSEDKPLSFLELALRLFSP